MELATLLLLPSFSRPPAAAGAVSSPLFRLSENDERFELAEHERADKAELDEEEDEDEEAKQPASSVSASLVVPIWACLRLIDGTL